MPKIFPGFNMARRVNMTNLISLLATLLSLLVTVSYGVWFISSIDKRIALLEKTVSEFSEDIDSFREQTNLANSIQDQIQQRFENAINERIINVENKMDNVHQMFYQLTTKSVCGGK